MLDYKEALSKLFLILKVYRNFGLPISTSQSKIYFRVNHYATLIKQLLPVLKGVGFTKYITHFALYILYSCQGVFHKLGRTYKRY